MEYRTCTCMILALQVLITHRWWASFSDPLYTIARCLEWKSSGLKESPWMCQIADLPENFALGLGMVSAEILINLRFFFHNSRFADLMYVNP